MDDISLTQELIRFNSINPPGNEEEIAKYVGAILADHGFKVDYSKHADRRLNKSAPYLTDASVLTPWLNYPPTIILGPGEPEMAHQTDEYCFVGKINEIVRLYKDIILRNSRIGL